MVRRRILLTALAAAPLGSRRARADATGAATAFIDKLLHDLITVVNGPGSTDDKRAALEKIVDSTVDLNAVARFCLGRFWRVATADQQREYTTLFHRVLVLDITSKVGEYKGVSFTMARTTPREDGVIVSTIITLPNTAPSKADWLVSTATGSPKLVDVIAEGVSLRLTQRDDYAGYLARNNNSVQALIDAMRQQAANPPS